MKKILVTILVLVIIVLAGLLGIKIYNNKNIQTSEISNTQNSVSDLIIPETEKVEEKQVKIFNGNERPIALMIDNVGSARPQAGLNDA